MFGFFEVKEPREWCCYGLITSVQFSHSVMSDSLWPPWTAAHQASLSFTNSWSLLKLMSIESVMSTKHLVLCRPFLFLPSIFPNIRVFSNESVLFASGGQSIGIAASVVPMNIQGWLPLGWTGTNPWLPQNATCQVRERDSWVFTDSSLWCPNGWQSLTCQWLSLLRRNNLIMGPASLPLGHGITIGNAWDLLPLLTSPPPKDPFHHPLTSILDPWSF